MEHLWRVEAAEWPRHPFYHVGTQQGGAVYNQDAKSLSWPSQIPGL